MAHPPIVDRGNVIVQTGLYGERLGRSFKVGQAPALTARTRGGFELAVTELRHGTGDVGLTSSLPVDDGYLLALNLLDVQRHETWAEGELMQAGAVSRGGLIFHDLQRDPITYLGDPFQILAFYVPRAALAEVSEELGRKVIRDFAYDESKVAVDAIVTSIGQSLLPLLCGSSMVNQLYIDHIFFALRSHLAVTYGGVKPPSTLHRGGLAPWQRKRALELLSEHLAEGIRLDELSQACSLSSSAFLRAFRKTMGIAPHQWLLARRVERACELIQAGDLPLSEIALCAGFSDQSHLTRVFSQQVGVSPGAWRREQTSIRSTRQAISANRGSDRQLSMSA